MLLPFAIAPGRTCAPEVIELPPGLKSHAERDPLPSHKQPSRKFPVKSRLTPPGDEEGAPEGIQRAYVLSLQGVGGGDGSGAAWPWGGLPVELSGRTKENE
jgi:hypothetical protein